MPVNPEIGDVINVSFDGKIDECVVQAIGRYDGGGIEYLQVLVKQPEGTIDFYAELYIEDYGDWEIV